MSTMNEWYFKSFTLKDWELPTLNQDHVRYIENEPGLSGLYVELLDYYTPTALRKYLAENVGKKLQAEVVKIYSTSAPTAPDMMISLHMFNPRPDADVCEVMIFEGKRRRRINGSYLACAASVTDFVEYVDMWLRNLSLEATTVKHFLNEGLFKDEEANAMMFFSDVLSSYVAFFAEIHANPGRGDGSEAKLLGAIQRYIAVTFLLGDNLSARGILGDSKAPPGLFLRELRHCLIRHVPQQLGIVVRWLRETPKKSPNAHDLHVTFFVMILLAIGVGSYALALERNLHVRADDGSLDVNYAKYLLHVSTELDESFQRLMKMFERRLNMTTELEAGKGKGRQSPLQEFVRMLRRWADISPTRAVYLIPSKYLDVAVGMILGWTAEYDQRREAQGLGNVF